MLYHFRINQELRETVEELRDRRLECRVDERPYSRLKPKIRKMLRELVALEVPRNSLIFVIKRILGDLGDFEVIGVPSIDEIHSLGEEINDDVDT